MMSAKKRIGPGDDAVFASVEEPKRRRNNLKKQSTFKPQPIINSSDTPPDDQITHYPPPPPSEKRPTRRNATRIRDRQSVSPSHEANSSKKRKTESPLQTNLNSSSFASSSRPRPSSPSQAAQARAAQRMGPPTGFIRKTRKSMRAMGVDTGEGSFDSVIPIPESETPMIRKNKELREAQQRRSSLGLRGQRASTSLGKGEISIPHSSVDTRLFYTHLGSQMPEPIRARHLIAWCAKRAVDAETGKKNKGKGKERTDDGDRIINEIMEEFITSLGRGEVDTNVFAQVSSSKDALLRPHPRNVVNKETYAKEEAIITRCKAENNQWSRLIGSTNRRLQETVEVTNAKRNERDEDKGPDITEAGWMTDALQIAEDVLAKGEGDLTKMGEFEDVEFKIDSLLNSTHVAVQYSRQAERFLDGIFSSLTLDLRNRERAGSSSTIPAGDSDGPDAAALLQSTAAASSVAATSTAGPSARKDPMFMLRALASADSRTQNDEAVAAAARVAPVQPVTTGQNAANLNASVGPGVTATPRRVGGATPRRVGG